MMSAKPSSESGFIILETNYRLYAYTDSPLQIAVLSLFVDLKARFANMVVGMVTRDRVRDALEKGISADQNPVLPETVVDQLRLWEMERNRLRASPNCWLYQQFTRFEDYQGVLKYAQDLGCLLWHSDKKRMLVITEQGHPNVKEFVKRKVARPPTATGSPAPG
ncbi:General transcription factor IIH subunit 4 [Quaeritorhiza haematococci]|nr:General transcription factor IIH subunit 4 [Quaeritorhiza haematococci]